MIIIINPNDDRTVEDATAPLIAQGYRITGKIIRGEVVLVATQPRSN